MSGSKFRREPCGSNWICIREAHCFNLLRREHAFDVFFEVDRFIWNEDGRLVLFRAILNLDFVFSYIPNASCSYSKYA